MHIKEQQGLRDKVALIMVEWAEGRQPPFTGETVEGFPDAIVAAHLVADETRLVLHRWIDAARRTGLTWSEIGDALGISKQAAQQRFRSSDPVGLLDGHPGEAVIRLGATAFNEMSILRAEGRKGNELIGTGPLALHFRKTHHAWEHCRVIALRAPIDAMAEKGWGYASSWAPFHYFKRPVDPG